MNDLFLFNIHARGVMLLMAVVLFTDFLGYIRGDEFVAFLRSQSLRLRRRSSGLLFRHHNLEQRQSTQFIYFQF